MAKPSSYLDWTVAVPTNHVEPSPSKKDTGWVANEKPVAEHINWNFFNIDEWIKYFESITDTFLASFDAVVGLGGTHATLQAAIDDGSIGTYSRILVRDPETVDTTISIGKGGLEIWFHPIAAFTKGTATIGIQVGAIGVKILNARILGAFTTAIDLTIIAKNCRIQNCNFDSTVVTDIADAGTNNILQGNLREVP